MLIRQDSVENFTKLVRQGWVDQHPDNTTDVYNGLNCVSQAPAPQNVILLGNKVIGIIILCCSVTQLFLTLCNSIYCSTPGLPILYYAPGFAQTQIHWVSDAIQPSHSLLPSSPPALNHSQHQGLFQWLNSLHQVTKVLKLQLQHQFSPWIFIVDFLWNPLIQVSL